MTWPGEPWVDFQTNWRDRCPVPDNFFLGYTNGYFGYFPTIRAAAQGGYGAANSSTWVEVGAGERMVDHAVAKIYEMLGRLTDAPRVLERKYRPGPQDHDRFHRQLRISGRSGGRALRCGGRSQWIPQDQPDRHQAVGQPALPRRFQPRVRRNDAERRSVRQPRPGGGNQHATW